MVTRTVSPGKLGVRHTKDTGKFTDVKKGGAAEQLGIQVGWRICKLDNLPFSQALMTEKTAGKEPYEMLLSTKG